MVSDSSPTAQLALRHVSVIDGSGAPVRPDVTILVAGELIDRIGPSTSLPVPHGAQIVDASGTFAVPGLADMHIHLGSLGGEPALERLAASGIVSVRDMATPVEEILRLRERANLVGSGLPRVVAAGPKLEGGPLPFEHPLVRSLATPVEARQAVCDLQALGVDFIKVGDTLSAPQHAAIAGEAKRLGIPFAGHLSAFVGAVEAAQAGQRSFEHFGGATLHGVLIACSTKEVELRSFVESLTVDVMIGKRSPDDFEAVLLRAEFIDRLLDSYSPVKAADLFATFADEETWQVPTLVAVRGVWDELRDGLDPSDVKAGERLWDAYMAMIEAMRTAGVRFLAGTDTPWPGDGAAAPLHDELELLVQAGLTPMETLQTATRDAADFLGTQASHGTIEVGKVADIVLLDANPLDDITNTRHIRAVIKAGQVVP